jgi:hypothetical protein
MNIYASLQSLLQRDGAYNMNIGDLEVVLGISTNLGTGKFGAQVLAGVLEFQYYQNVPNEL